MCLLRPRKNVPKRECHHEYGILMHNMEEDSFFGTCLMQDGRYVTLSWQHIHKALKKVLEDDYVISPTKEKMLQDLYNNAMADVLALEKQIEISQCAYQLLKANATVARKAKREGRTSTVVIPQMTILGTQEDSGDNDESNVPLAAKVVGGTVVAPKAKTRASGRKILSLTKRRSMKSVDNKASRAAKDGEEPITAESDKPNNMEDEEPRPNKVSNAVERTAPEGTNSDRIENAESDAKTNLEEHTTLESAYPNKVEGAEPMPQKDGDEDKGFDAGAKTTPEGPKSDGIAEAEVGANNDGEKHITAQSANHTKLEHVQPAPNSYSDEEKGINAGEQKAAERAKSDEIKEPEPGAIKEGEEHITPKSDNPNKLEDEIQTGLKESAHANKLQEHVHDSNIHGDTDKGANPGEQIEQDGTKSDGKEDTEQVTNKDDEEHITTEDEDETGINVDESKGTESTMPNTSEESDTGANKVGPEAMEGEEHNEAEDQLTNSVEGEEHNDAEDQLTKKRKKQANRFPPEGLYTSGQKKQRLRVFSCPICTEPADGSHQCGYRFAHIHAFCGLPFEGSSEGNGQRMDCGKCGNDNGAQ